MPFLSYSHLYGRKCGMVALVRFMVGLCWFHADMSCHGISRGPMVGLIADGFGLSLSVWQPWSCLFISDNGCKSTGIQFRRKKLSSWDGDGSCKIPSNMSQCVWKRWHLSGNKRFSPCGLILNILAPSLRRHLNPPVVAKPSSASLAASFDLQGAGGWEGQGIWNQILPVSFWTAKSIAFEQHVSNIAWIPSKQGFQSDKTSAKTQLPNTNPTSDLPVWAWNQPLGTAIWWLLRWWVCRSARSFKR